jgi:stage V sporulation protein G
MESSKTKAEQPISLKLEARAFPIKEPQGSTVAFASITINDTFAVHSLKVVNGEKGIFIAEPSQKDRDGEYRKIAFPITAEARRSMNAVVLDAYIKAAEKDFPELAAAAKTAREALDKQSLTQRIKDAANEGKDNSAPAKDKAAPAHEEAL